MAAIELQTPRLLLRQWQQADLEDFARLNGDAEVMAWFPAVLDRVESDALAVKLQSSLEDRGWGLWALQRKIDDRFIGFTGLNPFTDMPFADGVEIGWRLAQHAWGQGLATEAARRAMDFAFTELALKELWSFTAPGNTRSIAVMRRLGMSDTGDSFRHPQLPEESSLSEHVLYRIGSEDFAESIQSISNSLEFS